MPEKLYWEDIEVGNTIALGEKRVEKDEIIAFAQEFDPQPFHLDEQAAKDTMIGELIASGWHTNVMLMRMLYDSLLKDCASLGSGGLEEVKWLAAVRPGDVIRGTYTCLESRASKSRPDVGICRVVCEVINQDDLVVMSCRLSPFLPAPEWGAPAVSRFYEDIEPGLKIDLGSHEFTRDEIVDFAERFDPQPFHLDEEAARASLFGGLCASGWHTACIWMRLMVQHEQQLREELVTSGLPAFGFGVSPGFRDLTWPIPVYVGDVITYTVEYLEKRPLRSRPGWGLLLHRDEGVNQNGEVVMRMTSNLFVARRES